MSIESTSRKLALAGIDHTVVIADNNSPNIIRHDDPASFAKAYTRWVIETSGASGAYTRVLAGFVQAIIDELEKAKNSKKPRTRRCLARHWMLLRSPQRCLQKSQVSGLP